jgi:ribosomal protein S18 acetylase RimI-like enzyme
MQVRGCTTAIVIAEGDNTAAQALYEGVGFRTLRHDEDYEYRDQ